MSLLRAELALAKTPTVPFLPKPSMETPRISAALRLSKRCQPPRSGAVVRDYHGQGSQTRVDPGHSPALRFHETPSQLGKEQMPDTSGARAPTPQVRQPERHGEPA